MEYKDVEQWSNAENTAEQSSLDQDLPLDARPGVLWEEPVDGGKRIWRRVEVVSGVTGGRWAYWKDWKDDRGKRGIGPHPEGKAIADRLFNGDVSHFIGMLATPHTPVPGQTVLAWVLVEPRVVPPRPVLIPEGKPKVRYEKSKKVFDLETQEDDDEGF